MFDFLKMSENSKKPPALFEMGLHEILVFDGFQVLRVPGGWLYTVYGQGVEFVSLRFETGLLEKEVKAFKKGK